MKTADPDGIVIAASIALLIIGFTLYQPKAPVPDITKYIASDQLKREMKRHGVQVVFTDWKDRKYFIRKGKKVYLRCNKDELRSVH